MTARLTTGRRDAQ